MLFNFLLRNVEGSNGVARSDDYDAEFDDERTTTQVTIPKEVLEEKQDFEFLFKTTRLEFLVKF